MASGTYRGIVRAGAVVILEDGQALPEGTEVLITPLKEAEITPLKPKPGTPAAVLAAMAAAPPVPRAWVDELEQLIAEGHRPPSQENPL